jgi:hypothetical protein
MSKILPQLLLRHAVMFFFHLHEIVSDFKILEYLRAQINQLYATRRISKNC